MDQVDLSGNYCIVLLQYREEIRNAQLGLWRVRWREMGRFWNEGMNFPHFIRFWNEGMGTSSPYEG